MAGERSEVHGARRLDGGPKPFHDRISRGERDAGCFVGLRLARQGPKSRAPAGGESARPALAGQRPMSTVCSAVCDPMVTSSSCDVRQDERVVVHGRTLSVSLGVRVSVTDEADHLLRPVRLFVRHVDAARAEDASIRTRATGRPGQVIDLDEAHHSGLPGYDVQPQRPVRLEKARTDTGRAREVVSREGIRQHLRGQGVSRPGDAGERRNRPGSDLSSLLAAEPRLGDDRGRGCAEAKDECELASWFRHVYHRSMQSLTKCVAPYGSRFAQ